MIGIIGFNDLHLMQFLYKYTNVLDDNGVEYKVIYWNRSGVREEKKRFKGAIQSYDMKMNTYQHFWKKLRGFAMYSFYLYKEVLQQKYDKLIVLTTQSAVPLSCVLLKRYKNKFIYDYRDITKERKFWIYRMLVRKLINESYCTMMSSMGFLKTIGIEKTEKIVQAHNTQRIEQANKIMSITHEDEKPIRITFWGMVRQSSFNIKLCDAFSNDRRFFLTFHGAGETETLKKHCEARGYRNFQFTGRYSSDEIAGFAKNTDIVHCLYENDEQMENALQVKMYDAMKFRLPIILSKGSYASEYLKPYKVALDVDTDSLQNAADKIYEWYMKLDWSSMEKNYAELEKKIHQEDEMFIKMLLKFACGKDFE